VLAAISSDSESERAMAVRMAANTTGDTVCEQPYAGSAAPLIPAQPTLIALREAAARCQACHLWRHATQTVFGEGRETARVMLIGEQPGDREDLAGRPFVGPAGRLLDRALAEAGIDRADAYVTNVVKHFKSELRGGRRLHKKPSEAEILACRPWMDAEIEVLRPQVVVCLGATPAQALLGKDFRVTRQRGEFVTSPAGLRVLATVHPASVLRIPDDDARHAAEAHFIEDLKKVGAALASE
jgi:uracil-DNA glycosylase family protein